MSSAKLFTPLKVGAITATNRVFMAPLTRLRSIEPGDIPTPLMAEYYRQRASAGLIISEATQISAQAKGYAGAPGLHSDEQIAAWKKITQGVHAQGGHMAVQLWHTGRISHASLQPGEQAPVAPSAINAGTRTSLRDENGQAIRVETSTPRAGYSRDPRDRQRFPPGYRQCPRGRLRSGGAALRARLSAAPVPLTVF